MAPPKFADIGKDASDLFSDDFGGSANKLTFKSTASNGTNIKVEGSRSNTSGDVSALLETKFTHKASGVTVKEKWTTKNVVTTELSVKNKFVAGSDATLSANFLPNGGGLCDFKLKTGYVTSRCATNADVTAKAINAGTSVNYGRWLFGAGADFNLAKSALSGTKVTVGFSEGDLQVTSSISDGSRVSGSLFHTPCSAFQGGVQFSWNRDSADTGFAVAGKYTLDESSFVKAKLDKSMALNLSYVQTMRKGVTLRLSADVAANALSSDAHQLGLHLTIEN